jgi:hypothetical protein
MAKRILILCGIFIAMAAVLIAPEDLSSCMFFPETVYTTKLAPLDEPRFFRGQLDILQPHYRHLYLMAAYRYLSGMGLDHADQQALLAKPTGQDMWTGQDSPAIQGWLQARVQVGAPPLAQADHNQIDRFKMLPDRVFILNCSDDAFRNATATLVERGRTGASHDDLRAWVAAQDQVFANCSGPLPWAPNAKPPGPFIPAALPATAARWMQEDRAYQIAAAEFYAGQFDAASADFVRISGDRASPWHGIAPYLAGRALIRKATTVDAAAAPAAQEQLGKVLADADAAAWHESARGLSRYLRARTEPARALSEVARIVAVQKSGVAGAMNDYRFMLDQYATRGQEAPRDDDITDWLAAMQNASSDHALSKWRATRSLPWLVAALSSADRADPELMTAASQVAPSSPAFLTVAFHRLRLLPSNEARPLLDAILSRHMPAPARNLFLAERMRMARDWDELLRDAPRTAVATSYVGDENDYTAVPIPQRGFDDDAADILNRAPLALLRQAAQNSSLPPQMQLQVARAVWVRAILLNNAGTATAIAPVLAALAPNLKPYLNGYLSATDDQARAFAAAWLMLNNPGMRYSIDAGSGRATPISKLDQFRDNWWCPASAAPNSSPWPPSAELRLNAPLTLLYQGGSPEAAFLTEDQRAEAQREHAGLAAAPAAPSLLAAQAVEWAESHPHDRRAPEALHLAVVAGHYACGGDGQTGRLVKRAFELLHSRYPKTAAAQLTPYWYGAR